MGEPADSTHTLVSYVYKAAFQFHQFGWAAAFSVVILAILYLLGQIFLRPSRAAEPIY